MLTPIILAYSLTEDSRYLDAFYSVRSVFHGFPLEQGLRMARYNGISIVFPSREDSSFDDVWLREVYFPYKPKKGDVVVDIGAHMGFFTVKVARSVKEVIAFEPDPYNFRFLLTNIKHNDLSNVRALNCALGDRDCDIFLKRGYGYDRTKVTEDHTKYKVEMKTLDTLVKEQGIVPKVVKIDAEGYEMKILHGARFTLTHLRPKVIIACYHYPNELKDVVKFLSNLNYKCLVYQVPLVLQRLKETYIIGFTEPTPIKSTEL